MLTGLQIIDIQQFWIKQRHRSYGNSNIQLKLQVRENFSHKFETEHYK
jgi:hypothetical protein